MQIRHKNAVNTASSINEINGILFKAKSSTETGSQRVTIQLM